MRLVSSGRRSTFGPRILSLDSRLRTLEEMARSAMNCREHSIARLAWEEICEMTPDTKRLVEAHRRARRARFECRMLRRSWSPSRNRCGAGRRKLTAYEAAGCWLAYADYLANRLLVRKAREAVASACRQAEKSENPALISEAIGYAGLVAAMCGRASEASELVERALKIALDQELPEQTALAYRRRANVCDTARITPVKPPHILKQSVTVAPPEKEPASSPV